MNHLDKLVSYMKTTEASKNIQRKQTAHRMRLIKTFNIQAGDRVLEVGSGQGDTTVVLADAVTSTGHIHAVDIAASDYGAPISLKDATDFISSSEIGERITFSFETDVMDDSFSQKYDVIILSHSLFYFASPDDLRKLFEKLSKLASRICVADWDLDVQSSAQNAHAQAILLQGLYAKYHLTDANIRTIITKQSVRDLLQRAGWSILTEHTVDASDLDDAQWEIAFANELKLPELDPIFSLYQDLLKQTVATNDVESLNSFVLIANYEN